MAAVKKVRRGRFSQEIVAGNVGMTFRVNNGHNYTQVTVTEDMVGKRFGDVIEAKPASVARYVRMAPRKVRLVADLIRGKEVGEALSILRHTPRAASPILEKVLNAAIANAEHNFELDANQLSISEIFVDEGPTLKRFRPRAQGRASRINKRTSHITIILTENKEG